MWGLDGLRTFQTHTGIYESRFVVVLQNRCFGRFFGYGYNLLQNSWPLLSRWKAPHVKEAGAASAGLR